MHFVVWFYTARRVFYCLAAAHCPRLQAMKSDTKKKVDSHSKIGQIDNTVIKYVTHLFFISVSTNERVSQMKITK